MKIYNITNSEIERFEEIVDISDNSLADLSDAGWSFDSVIGNNFDIMLHGSKDYSSYVATKLFDNIVDTAVINIRNTGPTVAILHVINEDKRLLKEIKMQPNEDTFTDYIVQVDSKRIRIIAITGTGILIHKFTFEGVSEPAVFEIHQNSTMEILCGKSKGSAGFSIYSNIEYLKRKLNRTATSDIVSFLISVNGGNTFERITNASLKQLSKSNKDMILRIETKYNVHLPFKIYGIHAEYKEIAKGANDNYYETRSSALDLETFKELVSSNAVELSELVEDNKAWPVNYYPANTLKNIDIFNAYEFKSVTGFEEIRVLFPDSRTLTQLSFDQFGLKYDDITNIHIVKTTFERIFGKNTRPENVDIIYIPFIDQYFEINNVDDVKTNLNSVTYYDCTLKLLTNRESVAKDSDVLSIDEMINPLDFGQLNETAPNNTTETTSVNTIGTTDIFDNLTVGKQSFSNGKYLEVEGLNHTYGICFIDTETSGNANVAIAGMKRGWYRIEVIDGFVTMYTMKGKELQTFGINDGSLIFPFAKYIEVDEELTTFQKNQFYSSPTVPHGFKPLQLEWLVEALL